MKVSSLHPILCSISVICTALVAIVLSNSFVDFIMQPQLPSNIWLFLGSAAIISLLMIIAVAAYITAFLCAFQTLVYYAIKVINITAKNKWGAGFSKFLDNVAKYLFYILFERSLGKAGSNSQ